MDLNSKFPRRVQSPKNPNPNILSIPANTQPGSFIKEHRNSDSDETQKFIVKEFESPSSQTKTEDNGIEEICAEKYQTKNEITVNSEKLLANSNLYKSSEEIKLKETINPDIFEANQQKFSSSEASTTN